MLLMSKAVRLLKPYSILVHLVRNIPNEDNKKIKNKIQPRLFYYSSVAQFRLHDFSLLASLIFFFSVFHDGFCQICDIDQ